MLTFFVISASCQLQGRKEERMGWREEREEGMSQGEILVLVP